MATETHIANEPKAALLARQFVEMYGVAPRIFRAPGRVNLIGEHTDYNEGFVMPAAIQFDAWVAAAPRPDRQVRLYSQEFKEAVTFDLDAPPPGCKHWSTYVRGVASVLEAAGHRLLGADMLISGEVPIGSGLSSSAALEVSSGLAFAQLAGWHIGLQELAHLAQRAEHEFVGTRCGIMDQFISTHAQAGYALLLDCRTLEFELLPLPESAAVVICNTMVKHDLASGEYNVRRAQCEEGVQLLAKRIPGIRALRDVSRAELELHKAALSEVTFRRCRHVVSENERVLQSGDALKNRQYERFGALMGESHRSLRDDYEVSSRELDIMVEIAAAQPGCLGARMTGGGFGGCTVNVVELAAVSAFRHEVVTQYEQRCAMRPDIYVTQGSAGVEEITIAAQPSPDAAKMGPRKEHP
ncbi:MAG TPA: galactokinase [Terriglobales bacterium]|nr:galactokinase [Terriglobales bacterium]